MRRWLVFAGGMLVVLGVQAQAQRMETRQNVARTAEMEVRPIPPEMHSRFTALQSKLQPSVRSWVEQQARLEAQKPSPDLPGLESAIRSRFSNSAKGATLSGGDIESLAFVVLMQAANSSQQDLQQIMGQVKAANASKDKIRGLMSEVNKEAASGAAKTSVPCTTPVCRSLGSRVNEIENSSPKAPRTVALPASANPTYADLRNLQNGLKGKLDSMNEMSEMTSMRLQMAMDRRSKFIETLSNIMKKTSDTASGIVQNLK